MKIDALRQYFVVVTESHVRIQHLYCGPGQHNKVLYEADIAHESLWSFPLDAFVELVEAHHNTYHSKDDEHDRTSHASTRE